MSSIVPLATALLALGCAHSAPELFDLRSNPWVNLHHGLYALREVVKAL